MRIESVKNIEVYVCSKHAGESYQYSCQKHVNKLEFPKLGDYRTTQLMEWHQTLFFCPT